MEDKKDNSSTLKISGTTKLTLSLGKEDLLKAKTNAQAGSSVTVVKKKRIILSTDNDASDSFGGMSFDSDQLHATGLTSKELKARFEALKNVSDSTSIFDSKDLTQSSKEELVINAESTDEKIKIKENIPSEMPLPNMEQNLDRKNPTAKPIVKAEKEFIADSENELQDAEKDKNKADAKAAKSKNEPSRRSSGKINVNSLLDDDEQRSRSLSSLKRARQKAKQNKIEIKQEKLFREVTVPEYISVQDLANRMSERAADVIKELMKLGIIATGQQEIDADTAEVVISQFGHTMKRISDSDVERVLDFEKDLDEEKSFRAPVVTIMGHVDHGKTSLLDALRSTDIAKGEAGGITQHIGAYRITLKNNKHITFIDTPGHEAFTAMRSRGAKSTDIVVIVVAADDGVMAQTKEAIAHAKAADVPIIVAINKIDKPDADPARVRAELLNYDLVPEEFGGDIMVVEVSAKAKLNLDKLEEVILLQAEMMDLKARFDTDASGVVIESKVDKNAGIITTLLVQRGTLKGGDIVVAGCGFGKVKRILDDHSNVLKEAIPSMPVEVLGFNVAPEAGEKFNVVHNEKDAREIAGYRERQATNLRTGYLRKTSLEKIFGKSSGGMDIKKLSVILKGDVQGSIEAIIGSIKKFEENDEIQIRFLHTGVGAVTKSDVILANASGALVIGFNVRSDPQAIIEMQNVSADVRYYSVIYNLIDDIKAILSGMLSPIIREEFLGKVLVKQVFNITKVGKIAGSVVTEGTIKSDSKVRLLRENVVIYEGKIKNLKRFKDEVKEVRNGTECGLSIENYDDIREKDVIEVFEVIEERQKL